MKVLAGLALVALVVVGYPQEAGAGAVEVKIKITKSEDKCIVAVDPKATTVMQKRRDVLVWSFANECMDQEVLVCPVGAPSTDTKRPFEECKGDPGMSNIGEQFQIYVTNATVSCHINWEHLNGKFCFLVLNGPPNTQLTCPKPGDADAKCIGRGSELALEVDP